MIDAAAIVTPLLVLLVVEVAPAMLTHEQWARVIDSEHGILEWLTVLVLLPAVVACVVIAVKGTAWPKHARIWFAVLALGLFYFAGEEASWGQHALGFTPPASIAENNLQGEFNLHNADAWYHDLLNEIPRTLAGVFCVGVCAVMPWWRRSSPETPTASTEQQNHNVVPWPQWLVPSKALVVAGASVALIAIVGGLFEDTAWDQPGHWVYYALTEIDDELKETLIAVTLCFYALDRLRTARRASHIQDIPNPQRAAA